MKVVFADLVHKDHTCNAVPYGSALVAAYAMKKIGSGISVSITKKTDEIALHFEKQQPAVVCFSSYIWNTELSLDVARRIKERFSACITVFGGPNYPVDPAEQEELLKRHPEIDFFICREGEEAFVRLYFALEQFGFDAAALKENGYRISGCHYYCTGNFVAGDELPVLDLDEVPSPYLSGLCDRYLQEGYTPIIQTTRGCPFVCAYCQEGDRYFNAIRRYSLERTNKELWHIAQRAASRKLYIADSNFGMYPEDLEIAEEISHIQEQLGWPDFVDCISGKNNKSLVLNTAGKIRGGQFSAAIQSSDANVLHNIKRENISITELIETASEIDLYNTHSFSEIILALPGDTVDIHIKSVCDLIGAGIHVIRSHQFIMLPGAELSSAENRRKYGLETRFRVMPNTSASYELFGQSFHVPEIDEICVANDVMRYEDYLESRCFDLSVEIFYNNGVFFELHQFLKQQDISISSYILQLHKQVHDNQNLAKLYRDFVVDTQELWETRGELEAFLQQPGVIDKYAAGELGRNEQLAYKAAAFFENMEDLIEHSYNVAVDLLRASANCNDEILRYLYELKQFDLFRKVNPVAVDATYTGSFHYDFSELLKLRFAVDPNDFKLAEKADFVFSHSEKYRNYIVSMNSNLSSGFKGYVAVINSNPKIRDYFRDVSR